MRHFAILFSEFQIEKESVRAGKNSDEVVTACRCINVGLFISGSLRRDVVVSIIRYHEKDDSIMISFPGLTLKRVSPDERSISFFLLKAMEMANELDSGQKRALDNGIIVEKIPLQSLANQWSAGKLYRGMSEMTEWPATEVMHEDAVFLYGDVGDLDRGETLPGFSSPERFILEINLLADRALEDS